MKAYSDDLREKVLKALHNKQSAKDVAIRFDVGISWVYKISKRFRDTGSYKALPRSGRPRKLSVEDINKISEMVKINPSLTLDEIKERGNFTASRTTIHRALQKLEYTHKKNTFCNGTKPCRRETKTD